MYKYCASGQFKSKKNNSNKQIERFTANNQDDDENKEEDGVEVEVQDEKKGKVQDENKGKVQAEQKKQNNINFNNYLKPNYDNLIIKEDDAEDTNPIDRNTKVSDLTLAQLMSILDISKNIYYEKTRTVQPLMQSPKLSTLNQILNTLPPIQSQSTQPPIQSQSTQPPIQSQSTQPPIQSQSTQPPTQR